jgi:hypothetical protein
MEWPHRWNHVICVDCWNTRHPESHASFPEALGQGELEVCCYCASGTRSGIYVRENPVSLDLKCQLKPSAAGETPIEPRAETDFADGLIAGAIGVGAALVDELISEPDSTPDPPGR